MIYNLYFIVKFFTLIQDITLHKPLKAVINEQLTDRLHHVRDSRDNKTLN